MSVYNTFHDVAIEKAPKQQIIVDAFTRKAPIFAGMPVEASSDRFHNVYERVNDVTGAGLVNLDEALPEVSASTELEQIPLSVFGGKILVPSYKANMLGRDAYVAKRLKMILPRTAQKVEESIIYNNIRATAISNGNYDTAGGSNNTNYSICAVNWQPGETTGLYDPEAFGAGEVFDMKWLNGGNEANITYNSKSIPGYEMIIRSNFGVQLANERYISALVNVDPVNNAAGITAEKIDQLLLNAEYGDSTLLYMHPVVLTYLQKFKASSLYITNAETGIDRRIITWNGVPIVTSYNFKKGTEANQA